MSKQEGDAGMGTSRRGRAWRPAAVAVGVVVVSVGCGFILQAAQSRETQSDIPTLSALVDVASATAPAATGTVASPMATGFPKPFASATPAEELPDLSNIAGAWCIPKVPAQSGVVVEVVDGNQIKVRLEADGSVHTVRYIGVEAPEPDGSEKNARLVEGRGVRLVRDVTEADENGVLLRYVVTEDTFVNVALVLEGAARAVGSAPDVACFPTFQQAEQEASAGRLGLWAHEGEFSGFPTSEIRPYCDCGGRDLDCRDFTKQAEAQSCFKYCKLLGFGDVFHLDNDGDGYVCVGLP